MLRRKLPWILGVAIVWPGIAFPQGEVLRLSRQQAIAYALDHNLALTAARAQVAEAQAAVVVAGAVPDPSLQLESSLQENALNPFSGHAHDIGVGFTVPFPGKLGLRRQVATADVRSAEFNLTQLRQQVGSDTARAYDAILVARRHRDDLEQSKQLASDFVQKTQARFLAGTVAKVDVVKADTDLAQAENDLIANERAIATATASLNRLLGRSAGQPLETTSTLEVPASLADVATLEQLAESSRPEIQSAAAQIEGAHAARTLANRFWQPDLSLALTRNYVQELPIAYTTDLSVGFPLFFWQHRNGEVAAAQHREEELQASIADLRSQVSVEVQTAFTAASTALRQAIFIRDKLLPEAQEVYRVAAVSYGLGGSSALDLLDAKRTLLSAESQYVDALGAANDAVAALELAIGAPLPQSTTGDHR